jgi:Spy/CpxP family protein refolding chaperone
MNVRTLVFLIVILLVINVAAIGTILYERLSRPEFALPPVAPRAELLPDEKRPRGRLDLTRDQRVRLFESRNQLREELSARTERIRDLRGRLLEEIGRENPNRELIYELVEEMGRIHVEIQKHVVTRIIEDGAVLEPEQREFLLHMLEQRTLGYGPPHADRRHGPGKRGR